MNFPLDAPFIMCASDPVSRAVSRPFATRLALNRAKEYKMTNQGWGGVAPEAQAEAAPAEAPEEFAARRDKAILDWRAHKQQLDFYKNEEMTARKSVSEICFPHAHKGTQRYELGQGYKLKLVFGYTYTLGNKDLIDPITNEKVPVAKQVEGIEDELDALGEAGALLRERLIRWKPELVESEYLKLDPEVELDAKAKEIIDAILTVKPASPQLTLEEPK